ncbi:MAG: beta-glucuronidase [Melioribacteraceae bacterium]|nr:MAG: beta-glucuronidase [Melioribacteraceae bacterium]
MKSRAISFAIILFTMTTTFCAQSTLITNTQSREVVSLNGTWKYIVDPYENGYYNYRYQPFDEQENPSRSAFFMNSRALDKQDRIEYDFDKSDDIIVPGDWNTQKEKLYYYEGTVWYKKSFDYTLAEDKRLFLYFGAVNYKAEVYLNGKKLGTHIGGFTPFNFEITSIVKEKDNFVVVKVDNKRAKEGVPTLNTDWWNYGGITRDVKLVETNFTFVQDYTIQLSKENSETIKGMVSLNGSDITNKSIIIRIPELSIEQKIVSNENGIAAFEFKHNEITYWSPDNPKLYDIEIIFQNETIGDKIGFRSITTNGPDVLLNEAPVFLKGISIHEESPISGGRANSREDAKKLLGWAKELGCNFVRLAHYPHNEFMVRVADEMGILVWEEIPVYWTIDWENPETYQNAETQLAEVITRDKNRASVIIWSMANETPHSEARNIFLNNLATKARRLDPTRLISAALEQRSLDGQPNVRTIDDPFAKVVDVLSFNVYIGWYDGRPDKCDKISWQIDQNKPVIISEFGGGAKYGLHGYKDEIWTEEFQEEIYIKNLEMLKRIKDLRGMSPWILVDFRSPRRVLPEIQDDYNRKGLLSEKGEKKKAFSVLQEFYRSK